MKICIQIACSLLAAVTITAQVSAALQITEVMYDPVRGGEWIELYNPDDAPVDLKGWKLYDGASHNISANALLLGAGEYIILADDKNAFVSAFSDITTTIVDIVTAFNNDGDTIILRNASGADISQMSYKASAGASKNNKSLQLIGGEFLPWTPSIGTIAVVTKAEVEAATPSTDTTTAAPKTTAVAQQTSSPYHAWPSDMQIYVSAGGNKVSLAGAEIVFDGKVLSAAKKSLPNADLIWTFGDGGSDRGTQVRHTFHYPGRYVVLLDVISGDYIAKDQIEVEVIRPNLEISAVDFTEKSYVELYNNTAYDLDIGGFVLEAGGLTGSHFTIPKKTILLAGKKIIFPSVITKLYIKSDNVAIKFPSGELVSQYAKPEEKKEETGIVAQVEENLTQETIQKLVTVTSQNKNTENYARTLLSSVYEAVVGESTGETASTTLAATSTEQQVVSNTASSSPVVASVSGSGFDVSKHPRVLFGVGMLAAVIGLLSVLHIVDTRERKMLGISEETESIRIVE
jgi:Lamin Tail Domain/PKD domain